MVKLYEHEGKQLFAKAGIATPKGEVVCSAEEAKQAAARIGFPVVLKAQVYTGKRGKAGGILFAETAGEAFEKANEILGMKINGLPVKSVLVEEKFQIRQEFYAGILSEPGSRQPAVIFSRSGGMDVEENSGDVAVKKVNILKGFRPYEARNLLRNMKDMPAKDINSLSGALLKLYQFYRRYDCKLVEVNPLVITEKGLFALDAKVEIDDDSYFRQTELGVAAGEEVGARPPTALEIAAMKIDEHDHRGSVHFVQIDVDGSMAEKTGMIPIGFDGVGTGVSLTTMDELAPLGFYPVNFCDTSGNPTASKLYKATRIIFSQKHIKGYMFISCISSQQLDNTARGIIKALKELYPETGGKPDIPCLFVFRGAWDDEAVRIFEENGITECPWVEVSGRDVSEKEAAGQFSELYKKWRSMKA